MRWSLEEDLKALAKHGFQGYGAARRKLADCDGGAAKKIRDAGVDVESLAWIGGFTGSDGRSLNDAIADGAAAIRCAATLGAKTLIVYPGSHGGHTTNHAKRLLQSALQDLEPTAKQLGVRLAVKPTHSDADRQCSFLHHWEAAVRFVSQFDSRCVGLVYDAFHWLRTPDALPRLADSINHVALVQLADFQGPISTNAVRLPPGEGQAELGDLLEVLDLCGYEGGCQLELIGGPVQSGGYDSLLRRAKSGLAKLQGTVLVGK